MSKADMFKAVQEANDEQSNQQILEGFRKALEDKENE